MAAILAGGQARRFGGLDKGRLDVGGVTILDRILAAVSGVADRVVLVASPGRAPARADLEVLTDLLPDRGSLGGIYTALAAADGPALVIACDLPFLTPAFLAHLLDAVEGADVALPRSADGYHPLCACYTPACAAPIRRRLDEGRLKVTDALGGLRVREVGPDELRRFDPDGRLLLNVNTPEDLARAVARAGSAGA